MKTASNNTTEIYRVYVNGKGTDLYFDTKEKVVNKVRAMNCDHYGCDIDISWGSEIVK